MGQFFDLIRFPADKTGACRACGTAPRGCHHPVGDCTSPQFVVPSECRAVRKPPFSDIQWSFRSGPERSRARSGDSEPLTARTGVERSIAGKGGRVAGAWPPHLATRLSAWDSMAKPSTIPRDEKAPGDYIIPRSRMGAGLAFSHQRNACPLRRTTHYVRAVIAFAAWVPCCRRRFKICPGQPHQSLPARGVLGT